MLRRTLTSSWPPMAVTAIGLSAILLRFQLPFRDLVLFAGYLAVAVTLPGVFVWRSLLHRFHTGDRRPPTWFEDLSLGTIFGFGIQLPAYLVGVLVGAPLLFLALPVVVVVLSVATGLGRGVWTLPTERLDYRASWFLGATMLYGVAWLARNVFSLQPLNLPANQTPTVDETFHEALVSELLHHFPAQIPYLLDTRLKYHWFVHAQLAASKWVTDIETSVLLRQLLPTLMVCMTVLGLGAVTLRLSGRPAAAVIAPALLIAGVYDVIGPHYEASVFSEPYLMKRLVGSPSHSYGFTMALPAFLLIFEVLRRDKRPARLTWVALALALFALSGAKVTYMPILLCGAIAVWLFYLALERRFDRTAAALVGLLVIVTIFAQLVLFGGTSSGMAVEPFGTVRAAVGSQDIPGTPAAGAAMTMMLLAQWLLYGAGVIGLARKRRWRDPRAIWMLVAIPAGVSVAFIFARSGGSQLWFQRSVAGLIVIISAWGLGYLLPNPLTKRHAAILLGVAGSAGFAAFVISSLLEHARDKAPRLADLNSVVLTAATPFVIVAGYLLVRFITKLSLGRTRPGPVILLACLLGLGLTNAYAFTYDTVTGKPLPKAPHDSMFAAGGEPAAEWIRDHSDPDDVLATNVHCAEPAAARCDNRNFWISAYAERRIVVEGWGYNSVTNEAFIEGTRNAYIPIPDTARLALNDAAFEQPSEETVGALVDTYAVKWLFVSKKYDVDLPRLMSLTGTLKETFRNENYVVFKVFG